MNEFWSSQVLQYATIALSFIPLVLAWRVWHRIETGGRLDAKALRNFKRQCHETVAQYLICLGGPTIYTVVQTLAGGQALAANLTNGYLGSIALTGVASLWNVFKADRDVRGANAERANNRARVARLQDVDERNLKAYTSSLSSVIVGSVGLIAYNLLPSPPAWAWFVAFLLTEIAASGLVWSTAVASAASAYVGDPALGRAPKR